MSDVSLLDDSDDGTFESVSRDSLEVRCLTGLAAALLGFGLPAHRVEESVRRVGHAFGCTTSVLGLPTTLLLTLESGGKTETRTVRGIAGGMDLDRLDRLHSIVGRIERRDLDAHGALEEIRRTLGGVERYSPWVRASAGGVAALGAALSLGGGAFDLAVSFVACACVVALSQSARTIFGRPTSIPVTAAFAVSLVAGRVQVLVPDAHPIAITIAALLPLFPGFQLATATVELGTGHWVSGTARAVGALVVFLELGFGVVLGMRLGFGALGSAPLGSVPLLYELLGASLLTAGLAVLGNARASDAPPHFAISMLAFVTCRGAWTTFGPELSTLGAAFVSGLFSHAFARRFDRPSSVLLVPSTWMLVPGSLGMLGVSAALGSDSSSAFELVARLEMTVVALSTGLILAGTVLPPRAEI